MIVAYKTDICMIVHNDITHDSRVQKEATSLTSQGWNVLVVGIMLGNYADISQEETINGYRIKRVRPPFRATGTFKKIIQLIITLPLVFLALRSAKARSYHGHDFVGLLILALAGIWNTPIVYDSHELFFEQKNAFLPKNVKLIGQKVEKYLAQRSVKTITVSEGIAKEFVQRYQIESVVVRNLIDLRTIQQQSALSYNTADKKVIVHSGSITFGRHLPELISALPYLSDNVILVLMGDGSLSTSLVAQAKTLGVSEKLKIVRSVQPNEVVATLAQADVGLALITSEFLSYYYALPNKFFESISAGLPVLTSQNPDMKALVEQHNIGLSCDPTNPESIADAIKEILIPENYAHYKANVDIARQDLTWEHEEKKLIAIYKAIL